jgi:YVTN family beta-propeller protein
MNFMPFAVPIAIALSVIATSRDVSPAETAPGEGTLLVANKGDQTLGIIDPETGRQIATVREDGFTGHEIAASPDGRVAFVPIYGNSGSACPALTARAST